MIPIKLRIEGFLSYRQPVVVDFTGFNLACISGENGAGKSALLDAITWALFGQARARGESVINNHPSVEAAEVSLDFEYEGNLYRVLRTNPRGKTSSVELFIRAQTLENEGRWKPLTEHSLRETDKKIEQILRMDFETFTNASFFLQGKADQFTTARPAERKRILGNILGLELWERYRDQAALLRREKEKDVKELDGRLSEVQAELDQGPERITRLEDLQANLSDLAKRRQERAEILENFRQTQAALNEQHKMLAALQSQLKETSRDRDQNRETLEARREEKNTFDTTLEKAGQIEKAYQDWQQARQSLEEMEALAAQFRQHEALRQEPLNVIRTEEARLLQEFQGLQEQQAALENALCKAEEISVQLDTTREKIETVKNQLAQREALEKSIQQLQEHQAEAKAENPRLKQEMLDLRDRIERLKTASEATCPVCGQPLTKEEREDLIRKLTEDGETRRDRYYENKTLLETFTTKLQELGAALADLKGLEVELQKLIRQADQLEHQIMTLQEQEKTWVESGAIRLMQVTRALSEESFSQAARERLNEINAELAELGYDLEAHETLRKTEQAGRQAEADLLTLEQAKAALAPIQREIGDLETRLKTQEKQVEQITKDTDSAAAALAVAKATLPDVSTAEANLHDIQEQENLLRQKVGGAQQEVNILETMTQRRAEYLEERETMTQHIADLKQLERAFGKDGVPALLIEQALPEIQETTNELLSRLTNGRMSFSFMTQREYKDSNREDLKETLDMVISDSIGARDYEMFSGGEAFRVNFSIRLALSKLLARRAGARLQTLVIDEGFSSQDAQGRQRLVEAINLVRDEFEKILVITHLEELKDAFPTRIEVEKTAQGSQVRVI